MNTPATLLLALGIGLSLAAPSSAALDCAREAQKLARETGAEVLGATATGSGCEIKLLIPGKTSDEPPRVVTRTVSG